MKKILFLLAATITLFITTDIFANASKFEPSDLPYFVQKNSFRMWNLSYTEKEEANSASYDAKIPKEMTALTGIKQISISSTCKMVLNQDSRHDINFSIYAGSKDISRRFGKCILHHNTGEALILTNADTSSNLKQKNIFEILKNIIYLECMAEKEALLDSLSIEDSAFFAVDFEQSSTLQKNYINLSKLESYVGDTASLNHARTIIVFGTAVTGATVIQLSEELFNNLSNQLNEQLHVVMSVGTNE